MTRTIIRWLSLLSLLLLLTGPVFAAAGEGQIYTIKKGDTLWDLSKRFIDDPYYWPNIWSKNPEITNPHLIFPGQKIRVLDGRLEIIPAYPEKQAGHQDASPTPEQLPTGDKELITVKSSSAGIGFIRTDEQSLGFIVDAEDNRILLSKNDTVFVKMHDLGNAAIGDRFGLFEEGEMIKHPVTGEQLGTMMYNLGHMQITEISGNTVVAKISGVYREIMRGAQLYEYIPARKDVILKKGAPGLQSVIVASRDEKGTMSTSDVFFMNLGRANGLQEGNLLYLSRPRVASQESVELAEDFVLPDEVLGAAVVVDSKEATASAVIIKSVKAAFVGDQVSVVTD